MGGPTSMVVQARVIFLNPLVNVYIAMENHHFK